MDIHKEIDTRGLNCPLPILKAKKALAEMVSGQLLKVVATTTVRCATSRPLPSRPATSWCNRTRWAVSTSTSCAAADAILKLHSC